MKFLTDSVICRSVVCNLLAFIYFCLRACYLMKNNRIVCDDGGFRCHRVFFEKLYTRGLGSNAAHAKKPYDFEFDHIRKMIFWPNIFIVAVKNKCR